MLGKNLFSTPYLLWSKVIAKFIGFKILGAVSFLHCLQIIVFLLTL